MDHVAKGGHVSCDLLTKLAVKCSSLIVKSKYLLLALFLSGCAGPKSKDPVYTPPSWRLHEQDYDFDAKALPEEFYFVVSGPAAPTAKNRLEYAPAIKLALWEVSSLTGRQITRPPGTTPYLIRSIRFTDGGGGIGVWVRRDGSLRTYCTRMGMGPFPQENCALVVFLQREPRQVYANCNSVI